MPTPEVPHEPVLPKELVDVLHVPQGTQFSEVQRKQLHEQLQKVSGEIQRNAKNRRDALVRSMHDSAALESYRSEVQTAQKLLRDSETRIPEGHRAEVQQTIKELEGIARQIDADIEGMRRPREEQTAANPEAAIKSFQSHMQDARTPQDAWNRAKAFFERHLGDGFVTTGFFSFIGGLAAPFPFLRKFKEWAERHKSHRHIRGLMRDALPANMRSRVRSAAQDVEDAERLKSEYDAAPEDDRKRTTFDQFVKERMRKIHAERPKTVYTIKDLLENPASTREERDRLEKQRHENRVKEQAQTKEALERRVRERQREYATILRDAFALCMEGNAQRNMRAIDATRSYDQIAMDVAQRLDGKQGQHRKSHLYFHNSDLREWDDDHHFIGYVSSDHIIIQGLRNTLIINPRDAVSTLCRVINENSVMGNSSICEAAKDSLRRIAKYLIDARRPIDDQWQVDHGPNQPQTDTDGKRKAEADAKAKKDKADAEAPRE